MREIKFRAWDKKYGRFVTKCDFFKEDLSISLDGSVLYSNNADMSSHFELMQYTGLKDKNGVEIYEGDRLRFYPSEATKATNDGCIWDGTVKFEDGVFTVDILDAKQVKNPDKWDQNHEWIKSRWWGCKVGYGEYGTWNVTRRPLTEICTGFGCNQECYERLYKPIAEKVGWGERFINAEVIGNIYENPELLEKQS